MGSSVDGLLALQSKTKADDPVSPLLDSLVSYLEVETTTGDMFEAADQVLKLDALKKVLARINEAVSEQLELRSEILYADMLENEMQNFSRKGKKFYLTSQSFVQANPELGGTSSPQLIEWLRQNDMGEVAKLSVHAATLRSNINEWLESHPVEAVVDGSPLEGDELLEHLGLTLEEFEERCAKLDELDHLVIRTTKHVVGMRKG